jgi:hypothetical protein
MSARLLGHQPQHLLERVGGVERQRGVREEGRQLTRQPRLAAFEQGDCRASAHPRRGVVDDGDTPRPESVVALRFRLH